MTVRVRDFRPSDAEPAAAVVRAAAPYLVMPATFLVWRAERSPAAQRFRILVAEDDGRLVGMARCGLNHESSTPGQAFVNLTVHPDATGRGVGSALLAAGERYAAELAATRVRAWVLDDPHALRFAASHGYRSGRRGWFQRLDLTSAELPVLQPGPGVRLATGEEFLADPRPLYEVDAEAGLDEPGDLPIDALSYQTWLEEHWSCPALDRHLTSVAVVDGRVAAFSSAWTDGHGRYFSAFTASLREFRGRGLAKLVKADSLRRAVAAGCTEAITSNDADNGPMLAINRWLDYRPMAGEYLHTKDL